MRQLKYIVFFIMVMTGFIAVGEVNLLNLTCFQYQYYSVEIYSVESTDNNHSLYQELNEAAENSSVDLFFVDYTWDKAYKSNIVIIGTPQALKCITKDGVKEGINKSIFHPQEKVAFVPLSNTNHDINRIHELFFIGNMNDIEGLLDRIRARFNVTSIKGKSGHAFLFFYFTIIWGSVYAILLLLSAYLMLYSKKETAIEAVHGGNIVAMVFRNAIIDIILYTGLYLLAFKVASLITTATFKLLLSSCIFGVFLLFNTIINLYYLKIDFKKALHNAVDMAGIYNASCTLCIIAVIITSVSISSLTNCFGREVELDTQSDFFKKHDSYCFYKLSYGFEAYDETGYDPDEIMYRRLYERYQNNALVYADLTGNYGITYPLILINKNALYEVCNNNQQIKELQSDVESHNVSILFPETIKKNSVKYNRAIRIRDGSFFSENEYGEWNELVYKKGVHCIGIHDDGNGYQFKEYSNPVIIVDNTNYISDLYKTGYDSYYSYDILYDISEDSWANFQIDSHLENNNICITNANEEFQYLLSQKNKQTAVHTSLTFSTIVLVMLLLYYICNLNYKINSIEIIMQKIHGYTFLERNRSTIIIPLIGVLAGTVLTIIINLFAKRTLNVLTMLCSGLFTVALLVLEVVFIAYYYELKKAPTILKGGQV